MHFLGGGRGSVLAMSVCMSYSEPRRLGLAPASFSRVVIRRNLEEAGASPSQLLPVPPNTGNDMPKGGTDNRIGCPCAEGTRGCGQGRSTREMARSPKASCRCATRTTWGKLSVPPNTRSESPAVFDANRHVGRRGQRIALGGGWPLGMRVVYSRSFMRFAKSSLEASMALGSESRSIIEVARTLAATIMPL